MTIKITGPETVNNIEALKAIKTLKDNPAIKQVKTASGMIVSRG